MRLRVTRALSPISSQALEQGRGLVEAPERRGRDRHRRPPVGEHTTRGASSAKSSRTMNSSLPRAAESRARRRPVDPGEVVAGDVLRASRRRRSRCRGGRSRTPPNGEADHAGGAGPAGRTVAIAVHDPHGGRRYAAARGRRGRCRSPASAPARGSAAGSPAAAASQPRSRDLGEEARPEEQAVHRARGRTAARRPPGVT